MNLPRASKARRLQHFEREKQYSEPKPLLTATTSVELSYLISVFHSLKRKGFKSEGFNMVRKEDGGVVGGCPLGLPRCQVWAKSGGSH